MSTAGAQPRLRVAFAGAFAVRLEQPVRAHLRMPCDIILADEAGIVSQLADVDVLVTMAFTREMGGAAKRLKLVQVPGAGLERIDRSALPAGAWLAAEIIDEEALYRALAERTIAGAALDVWYRYPTAAEPTLPARQPFHELPNVLMTPHVSGWTDGMVEARAQCIAENIHRAARDEPPVHLMPAAAP